MGIKMGSKRKTIRKMHNEGGCTLTKDEQIEGLQGRISDLESTLSIVESSNRILREKHAELVALMTYQAWSRDEERATSIEVLKASGLVMNEGETILGGIRNLGQIAVAYNDLYDSAEKEVQNPHKLLRDREDLIRKLIYERDHLEVQLAECGVVATGWATDENECKTSKYEWSSAYADVLRLRQKYEALKKLLIGSLNYSPGTFYYSPGTFYYGSKVGTVFVPRIPGDPLSSDSNGAISNSNQKEQTNK